MNVPWVRAPTSRYSVVGTGHGRFAMARWARFRFVLLWVYWFSFFLCVGSVVELLLVSVFFSFFRSGTFSCSRISHLYFFFAEDAECERNRWSGPKKTENPRIILASKFKIQERSSIFEGSRRRKAALNSKSRISEAGC